MSAVPVAVGFKAHLGWLSAVALTLNPEMPEPVLAVRLELFADEPRAVREPYHVAGGWDGLQRVLLPDYPARLVRRGRMRQDELTLNRLSRFRAELEASGCQWRQAVMLTGRGTAGDLADTLRSHARIHVAEGEAVRQAGRAALQSLKVPCTDQDEKSAMALAGERLGRTTAELDTLLGNRRPPDTPSWNKEHRTICAAVWLAIRG